MKLIPTESKVAIILSNRPEYFFVEQGCYIYGFIVVDLYTTDDCATILNVRQRSEADILVIDNFEDIKSIIK